MSAFVRRSSLVVRRLTCIRRSSIVVRHLLFVHRPSFILRLSSVVVLLLLATACSQVPSLGSLENTEWVLVSLNEAPAMARANVTAEFRDGQVSGYASCNWYGGEYSAQWGTLKITDPMSTARLCEKRAGVMEQEQTFLGALRGAQRYAVLGGWLHIEGEAGEKLTFLKRAPLAMEPQQLVNTRWQLVSINEAGPLADSEITLEFQENSFSGHAGCRDYRGSYQAEGDRIQFPALEMGMTECAGPEALLIQEGDFTTYLSESRYYVLEGQSLGLTTMAGDVLRFTRVE